MAGLYFLLGCTTTISVIVIGFIVLAVTTANKK